MMKSFFKKLSLVMALAMVVSLVAPAGSAFAATAGIALQGTTEVVTEVNVEVGAEVADFCFLGAPADWKTTFAWSSDNEAVATVDKAGKVTALKNGVANITITAGADASYKHTVKVTVGTTADADVFQLTEIQSKVKFNQKVSFKKEDASLYKIFETAEGPVEVYWPIDEFKLADDGMSLTFKPFVQYADGDNYVLRIGAFEEYFTTAIGEVTHVETTFGTNVYANNKTAYITPEDMNEITVNLGVKIYAGSVDLTTIYKDKYDITYAFVGAEPEEGVDLDEEGSVVFEAKVPVQITAVLAYEDEEGEDKTLANVIPAIISPVDLPAYAVERVVDWAVIPSAEQDWWDFSWNNKTVPAGDDNYEVVVKMVDNRGNYFVTNKTAAANEDQNNDNPVYWTGDCDDTEFDDNGYSVAFYSTNTEDFLVDTDGSLATYKSMGAVIYVSLYNEVEGETKFVKNITAFKLEVGKERKLDKLTANATKFDLVVDAMDEADYEDFVVKTFKIQAYDQYGWKWADARSVNDNLDVTEFEVVSTNPEVVKGDDSYTFDPGNNGYAELEVNANELYNLTGKTSVKFTIKEKKSGETITLTVSLKKPDWATADEIAADLFNVVDSISVTETDKNGNVTTKDQLILDTSRGYLDVALGVYDVNLGYNKYEDAGSLSNIQKSAWLKIYKTSDDYNVGYFDSSEIEVLSNPKWDETTSDKTLGDKYVAIYGPDGKMLEEGVTWSGNNVKVDLLTNESGELKYAAAGRYTMEVYTVYEIGEKSFKTAKRSTTFNVSYGQATINYVDQDDITTTVDFRSATKENPVGVKEAVLDALLFSINGTKWNINATNVIDSVKFTVKGDYIIIHSIKFKVPYDGETTLSGTEAFYFKEVKDINKSIKFVTE